MWKVESLREFFESSNFLWESKKKNEVELLSFFWYVNLWTQEKDSRELPSSFLKIKECKVCWNFWFAWTRVKWEEVCFLDVLIVLRKVKEEVRWSLFIAWPSLGLWGLSTCMVLKLYMCWISTILSHASCLIKILTMYLITQTT